MNPSVPRHSSANGHESPIVRKPRATRHAAVTTATSSAPTVRLIVALGACLLFFYCARSVVLPVLLAWVGATALHPAIVWLRALRISPPLGALLIMGVLLCALSFGLVNLGRPVGDWLRSAPESLPRLREKYQSLFRPLSRLEDAWQNLDGKAPPSNSKPAPPAIPAGGGAIAGTVFTWTGSLLTGVAETGVLLFLLLATGDRFTARLAGVFSQKGDKNSAMETSRQIQRSVSRYLFAVTLINTIFGTCVGLSLWLAGMPNAAMWGVIAAAANFVPYFGPCVGIFAVAVAGLLAFDSVGHGLLPAGLYLLWHLLEADLATPMLLGRRFKLSPVVIFVALMFCAWLWGFLGALLAMPLLVTLKVICGRLPTLAPLGELLAG